MVRYDDPMPEPSNDAWYVVGALVFLAVLMIAVGAILASTIEDLTNACF